MLASLWGGGSLGGLGQNGMSPDGGLRAVHGLQQLLMQPVMAAQAQRAQPQYGRYNQYFTGR